MQNETLALILLAQVTEQGGLGAARALLVRAERLGEQLKLPAAVAELKALKDPGGDTPVDVW